LPGLHEHFRFVRRIQDLAVQKLIPPCSLRQR
jgi:hypothetical protein